MDADVFPVTNHYSICDPALPSAAIQRCTSNATYCLQHVRPYDDSRPTLRAIEWRAVQLYYAKFSRTICTIWHPVSQRREEVVTIGFRRKVPKILNSHAYKDNGALFITWDEGTDFTDGPMG